MTLLEFLDRFLERRAQNPTRPRDIRQFIGAMFLAGYYVMLYRFLELREAIPADNLSLIRDAMLTLGPPIGIIIGAMFRSDAREEQATQNTARAFQAITETAKASAGGAAHEAGAAADQVADAAVDEAKDIKKGAKP